MDLLDRLLGHNHWATTRLLELSRTPLDARLDQPFDIGRRTLHATFEHMIFNVGGRRRNDHGVNVTPSPR
jgi:hypothetical protein